MKVGFDENILKIAFCHVGPGIFPEEYGSLALRSHEQGWRTTSLAARMDLQGLNADTPPALNEDN
jgi:hypothetical protein